jgi:hypothetical protein
MLGEVGDLILVRKDWYVVATSVKDLDKTDCTGVWCPAGQANIQEPCLLTTISFICCTSLINGLHILPP